MWANSRSIGIASTPTAGTDRRNLRGIYASKQLQVESLFQENIKRIFIATIGRGDELDGLFVRIKRKSLKP